MTAVGNATLHAFEHHNGNSAFVTNFDGSLIMISFDRVFMHDNLYQNGIGSGVDVDVDYASLKDYTLNKTVFKQLHAAILNLQIANKIVLDGIKFGRIFRDQIF